MNISQLGCKIALDDFGTGYSSVSHFLHFPIDTVKLDKSIMPRNPADISSLQLINGLVLMAKQLNINIVAEGIENEFQLNIIKEQNIECAQGYYFMKPSVAQEIETSYFSKGKELSSG